MVGPKGAIDASFATKFDSMNVKIESAPKIPVITLQDVPATDLLLQKVDPKNSPLIALFFSVTTEYTRDVSEFLCTGLGAGLWLECEECQLEMRQAAAS